RKTIWAHDASEGVGPEKAFGVKLQADQGIVAQEALIDPGGGLAHGTIGSPEP
ncbi:MAG: hypothetical protein HY677_02260, partial [Chloroflexi bacterium]|nr:hypothetical protein [Chloroflexota bacterium]